jgi:hypothetical protein
MPSGHDKMGEWGCKGSNRLEKSRQHRKKPGRGSSVSSVFALLLFIGIKKKKGK